MFPTAPEGIINCSAWHLGVRMEAANVCASDRFTAHDMCQYSRILEDVTSGQSSVEAAPAPQGSAASVELLNRWRLAKRSEQEDPRC